MKEKNKYLNFIQKRDMGKSLSEILLKYWGKGSRSDDSWHPLPFHCLDVARVAVCLLDAWPGLQKSLEKQLNLAGSQIHALVAFLVTLHDIGKFSIRFQAKRPDLLEKLQNRNHSKSRYLHANGGLVLWQERGFKEVASLGLGNLTEKGWGFQIDPLVMAAIGHHGVPAENFDSFIGDFNEQDIEAALLFLTWAGNRFLSDVDLGKLAGEQACKKASWLVAGLTVFADWFASQHMEYQGESKQTLDSYWESLGNKVRGLLRQKALSPIQANSTSDLSSLFPGLSTPTELQRLADSIPLGNEPQLFILESRTGSGKTEAAIRLAQRLMLADLAEGLYFALPTMATANGIFARVSAFHQNLFEGGQAGGVMLVHSARNLNPEFVRSLQPSKEKADVQAPEESILSQGFAFLADSRKLAFLAQLGVGTIDQALLAVLPVKHQSLALMALSRRVLIVDEVHAYDAFTSELLKQLLAFHAALGGSAILLSATLPTGVKAALTQGFQEGGSGQMYPPTVLNNSAYPLLTHVCPGKPTGEFPLPPYIPHVPEKPVIIVPHSDRADMLKALVHAANEGMAVAYVRNTVDDAKEAYQSLLGIGLDPNRTHLFHARMALGDRLKRESNILEWFGKNSTPKERSGRILVATQVIEQSLDLDFDCLFTDLAPVDLLLQRAGRLHRHCREADGRLSGTIPPVDRRTSPARLHVLFPPAREDVGADWYSSLFPRAKWVYPRHDLLWLTARLLEQKPEWNAAEESRQLVESVYGNNVLPVPIALRENATTAGNREKSEESQAAQQVLKLGEGYGGNTGTHWEGPENKETRLGQQTLRFRLGVWDAGRLLPLCPWEGEPTKPWYLWEQSLIQLPAWRIGELPDVSDQRLKTALEGATIRLPKKGRDAPILPLVPDKFGRFSLKVRDRKNQGLVLSYSHVTGMEFFAE